MPPPPQSSLLDFFEALSSYEDGGVRVSENCSLEPSITFDTPAPTKRVRCFRDVAVQTEDAWQQGAAEAPPKQTPELAAARQGYACSGCGHVFSLRKTRDAHQRAVGCGS